MTPTTSEVEVLAHGLALLKVASRREKRADLSPDAQAALRGGLVGAGALGVTGLLANQLGPSKKKRPVRSFLTGALLGGGLGAAGTYGARVLGRDPGEAPGGGPRAQPFGHGQADALLGLAGDPAKLAEGLDALAARGVKGARELADQARSGPVDRAKLQAFVDQQLGRPSAGGAPPARLLARGLGWAQDTAGSLAAEVPSLRNTAAGTLLGAGVGLAGRATQLGANFQASVDDLVSKARASGKPDASALTRLEGARHQLQQRFWQNTPVSAASQHAAGLGPAQPGATPTPFTNQQVAQLISQAQKVRSSITSDKTWDQRASQLGVGSGMTGKELRDQARLLRSEWRQGRGAVPPAGPLARPGRMGALFGVGGLLSDIYRAAKPDLDASRAAETQKNLETLRGG